MLAADAVGDLLLLPPDDGARLHLWYARASGGFRVRAVVDDRCDPLPFAPGPDELARWRDLLDRALERAAR